MDTYKEKDKNRALIGTILFHALILLFLIFSSLKTPLPLPEEEGVIVALGYSEQGTGDRIPSVAPRPVPSTSPESTPSQADDVVTQATDESIAIPDADTKADSKPQPEPTPKPQPEPKPTEEIVPEPVEEPKPIVDPRALFPGRDDKSSEQQSQGDTGDEGDQGRPDGHLNGEAYEGGGQGGGVEFSLTDRKANYLPIPEYTTAAQGRVVVSITVNRNGQVTRATAGARGTTTTDRTLWQLAEDAARRAKFDIKQNAPEVQTGTITYNFIRIN